MLEIEIFLALFPILLGIWTLYRGTGVFLFYFLLVTLVWPEGISYNIFGFHFGYARVFPATVIALYFVRFLYEFRTKNINRKMMGIISTYFLAVVAIFFVTSAINFLFVGYFPRIFLKSAVLSLWTTIPFFLEAYNGRLNLMRQNLVSQLAWVVGFIFVLISPQSIVFYLKYSDSLWRVRQGDVFMEHFTHLVIFYFNEIAVFFFTLGEESSMLFSIFSSPLIYIMLKGIYQNKLWSWLALSVFLFVITINQYLKMAVCFYIQVALFPAIYLLHTRIRFGHFAKLKVRKTIIVFAIGLVMLPTVLETRRERMGEHKPRKFDKVNSYLIRQFNLGEYTNEHGDFYIFAQKLRNRSGWVDEEGNKGGNRLSRIQITFDKFLKKPFLGYGLISPPEGSRRENEDPYLSGVSYLVDHLYIFGIFGGLISYLFMLVGPFYFCKRSFYKVISLQESYFFISFWVIAFFMSIFGFIPRNASSKSLIHFFNLWIMCRFYLLSSSNNSPKLAVKK